jgi:hypothetical protein
VRYRRPAAREAQLRERTDAGARERPHPEDSHAVAALTGHSDVLPVTRPRRPGTDPIDTKPRRRLAGLRFDAKRRTKGIIGLWVWPLWDERMKVSALA